MVSTTSCHPWGAEAENFRKMPTAGYGWRDRYFSLFSRDPPKPMWFKSASSVKFLLMLDLVPGHRDRARQSRGLSQRYIVPQRHRTRRLCMTFTSKMKPRTEAAPLHCFPGGGFQRLFLVMSRPFRHLLNLNVLQPQREHASLSVSVLVSRPM